MLSTKNREVFVHLDLSLKFHTKITFEDEFVSCGCSPACSLQDGGFWEENGAFLSILNNIFNAFVATHWQRQHGLFARVK